MGQYYHPISLDAKEYLYSHNFDSSLRLMEHSYIGNPMCNVVEHLLCKGNPWYKTRIVWAGDYGDYTMLPNDNLFRLRDTHFLNANDESAIRKLNQYKEVLPEEYFHYRKDKSVSICNLYSLCYDEKFLEDYGIFKSIDEYVKTNTDYEKHTIGRFIVNHTKKLYVDKYKCQANEYNFIINPLPILTCDGNGRGDGDFYTNINRHNELIGHWMGDVISIDSEEMYKENAKGEQIYEELEIKFIEK